MRIRQAVAVRKISLFFAFQPNAEFRRDLKYAGIALLQAEWLFRARPWGSGSQYLLLARAYLLKMQRS